MRIAQLMLSVLLQFFVVSGARAQERGPWTAALSITRKALAVGECSAVALDLTGAKGEWPRGPNGQLVSMSDFDLSVSAPSSRAAVGKYDGANSFSVCACPKAPVGTVGSNRDCRATAVVDYVPTSWAPQATFYKSVVRANCTMCHLAAPDSWNFASWQNFQDNANLIYADVCLQHTRPHAEVPFKNFWLKDTGILYLPGLLPATLGKPGC